MTVQNPEVRTQTARRILFGIFQGNRMPLLNPTTGFDALSGQVDYVSFADLDERTSWSLVAPPSRAPPRSETSNSAPVFIACSTFR